MNNIVDSDLENPDALKVTSPRKTELREKKNVNYLQMNRVGSIVSPDDSEEATKIKKQDSKKAFQLEEVKKRVNELFEKINSHEHTPLFNAHLDQNHPNFEEVKSKYTTLALICLQYQTADKYKATDEICQDIKRMISTNMQMAMTEGNQTKQTGCSEFLNFFENEFKGLEGLSLVKGADPKSDKKKPPPSNLSSRQT